MKRIVAISLLMALSGCSGSVAVHSTTTPPVCPSGTFRLESTGKCVPGNPTATTTESPIDTATPPDEEGPKVLTVGEIGTVTEAGEDTGAIVVTSVKTSRRSNQSYGGESPSHGRYVRIIVTARAIGSSFDINPYDFYMRSDDGTHYGYGDGKVMYELGDNSLDAVTLNKGEKVKGEIVFDVPPGDLELVYAPQATALAIWRLRVK